MICSIPCRYCENYSSCSDMLFINRCRSCIHDKEDLMVSVCRDCVGFGQTYDVKKDFYRSVEK